MKIRKFPWKTYKEALAWNYDKGLDEQICCRYGRNDPQGNAGRRHDCQRRYTAKAVLQTVMRLKPTEEQLQQIYRDSII